jgi:hypothetical protein
MHRSRALTILVVGNLVASVLHFGDNIVHFHEYPEPSWIPSPHIVDALWFAITPLLLLAWWLASQGRRWPAIALFWSYGALSMFVLGHYNFASPAELSFRINFLIWLEALAALLLIVLVPRYVESGYGAH